MSTWALLQIIRKDFAGKLDYRTFEWTALTQISLVAWIAIVLVALAGLMAIEAVVIIFRGGSRPRREGEVELASI
jgi:hypothetical protein